MNRRRFAAAAVAAAAVYILWFMPSAGPTTNSKFTVLDDDYSVNTMLTVLAPASEIESAVADLSDEIDDVADMLATPWESWTENDVDYLESEIDRLASAVDAFRDI